MNHLISTFSIVGFDPRSNELGVAVQSKVLAAAAVVPWAQAGIGAIATQARANTTYGSKGLTLLKEGQTPEQVVAILTQEDEHREERQLGIVDAKGASASFTGGECIPWAGGILGENFSAQGNILEGEETISCMARTFQETEGTLAHRLVESLLSGQEAGGDKRGSQSAGLLVVKEGGGYDGGNDRYIDLRVDDHPTPIQELKRLLTLFNLYSIPHQARDVALEGERLQEIKENLTVLGYYRESQDADLMKSLEHFYLMENFAERDRNPGFIPEDILLYMRQRVKEKKTGWRQ